MFMKMWAGVLLLMVINVSGLFADGGSAAQGEFLKAASVFRESYRFAHTNVEDLLKKHGVDGEYVAVLVLVSLLLFIELESSILLFLSVVLQLFICILQGHYFVPATSAQQQI